MIFLLRARLRDPPEPPEASLKSAFKEALALAASHEVAPALSRGVRRIAGSNATWADLLPLAEVVESENAERNRRFQTAAIALASILTKASVRSVFLKGAATLLEYRDHAPWRHITDLDVLVSPEDIHRVVKTLLEHGYHQQVSYMGFEVGLHHHYPALFADEFGPAVELHVRLMQDEKDNLLSTADILDQAVSFEVARQKLLIPSPEHRIIHLIAHAQIGNWGYALRQVFLKDVVEAAEINARHKIDWKVVREVFHSIGAENELMGFVWAAHALVDFELPFLNNKGCGRGWASDALRGLHTPRPVWRSFFRIVVHYVRIFYRNPKRLILIWKTITVSRRLKQLWEVNRERMPLLG